MVSKGAQRIHHEMGQQASDRAEIARLKARIEELEAENAELRGERRTPEQVIEAAPGEIGPDDVG